MGNRQQDEMRKRFFNEHAEHWLDMWYRGAAAEKANRFGAHFERLFTEVPVRAGDCVLDVGCGTGVLVPHILPLIGEGGVLWELDYAEKMIAVNRQCHAAKNLCFLVADIANADLAPESFDVIFCFSCFPHFDDKPRALATMARAAKRGGYLAIAHFASAEDVNRHHEGCCPVMHDRLPPAGEMRELVQAAGFEVLSLTDEPEYYLLLAQKPRCGA